MNNKNYDLKVLINDTIEEFKTEYKNYSDIDNAVTEIADSNVPIYYYDLAQYLAHNRILGFNNELGEQEVFKILQHNIYSELTGELYNYISENSLGGK